MLWGCTAFSASAYALPSGSSQPDWGYQPVHEETVVPETKFITTSLYMDPNGEAILLPFCDDANKKNKVIIWGEPEDDPIGVVPNPVPVGSPLVLLLLAAVYIVWKRRRLIIRFCKP